MYHCQALCQVPWILVQTGRHWAHTVLGGTVNTKQISKNKHDFMMTTGEMLTKITASRMYIQISVEVLTDHLNKDS